MITPAKFMSVDRYMRFEDFDLWRLKDGPQGTIRYFPQASGGAARPFQAAQYLLRLKHLETGATSEFPQSVMAGLGRLDAVAPLADLAEGWHIVDLVPTTPTAETTAVWALYVQRGDTAIPQPWVPVVQGSKSMVERSPMMSRMYFVPKDFNPRTAPVPARETPAMPVMPTRAQLWNFNLVPHRGGPIYRPRVTEGVLNTFQDEPYFFSSWTSALTRQIPGLAQMDGPRGTGTVVMPTHLAFGRNGGMYFCEGTRVGHISAQGAVRTLAGARHGSPPVMASHSKPQLMPELVGDWSALPEPERGFHELWGLTWDERTTREGSGAPIRNDATGAMEAPHDTAPVAFVADSQRNRICRLEFTRDSHGAAKVTVWKGGLLDPWDVVAKAGRLYVTERQANRVCEYDIDTGALLRVLAEGASLATVHPQSRKGISGVSRDVLRAQPCALPEGIYELDGWIYWGSYISAQIKRVSIETGAIEVVQNIDSIWQLNQNSMFVKIAVSDGTFGPRGHVFFTTWSNVNYGFPIGLDVGSGAGYVLGPGLPTNRSDYGSALAVKDGRFATGSMSEGVTVFCKALPSDPVITPTSAYLRGEQAWFSLGYYFTHGPGGWGYNRDPLPWGESADIDAFLEMHGHQRPA